MAVCFEVHAKFKACNRSAMFRADCTRHQCPCAVRLLTFFANGECKLDQTRLDQDSTQHWLMNCTHIQTTDFCDPRKQKSLTGFFCVLPSSFPRANCPLCVSSSSVYSSPSAQPFVFHSDRFLLHKNVPLLIPDFSSFKSHQKKNKKQPPLPSTSP